eukprot:554550-Prorocentrum_minimum.AAC.1
MFAIVILAVFVAAFSTKLETSTAEERVLRFLEAVRRSKGLKDAAARCVQAAWRAYRGRCARQRRRLPTASGPAC